MRFSQSLFAAAVASALVSLGAVAPEIPVSAARLAQAPLFKNPVALQLYSYRESFKTNGVPATLAKVKGMGFTHVELAGTYGLTREQLRYSVLIKPPSITKSAPVIAEFAANVARTSNHDVPRLRVRPRPSWRVRP